MKAFPQSPAPFVYFLLFSCCVVMDSTKKDELPSWATELEDAYIKDNFVHGFIKEEETLKRVLELHGRSSLVNFIHR